jgi:hypothetical protein
VKRLIPRLIIAAVGIVLIATSFVAKPAPQEEAPLIPRLLAYADRDFSVWFAILAVFAFALGGANLIKSHGMKVAKRRRDWPYSVVTLISFASVLVIGLMKVGGAPGWHGSVTDPDTAFSWVFEAVYGPLQATLFSLLAFFVVSAAYRAFRLRSLEATILLAAAAVVLVGRTPIGVVIGDLFPDWLTFLRPDVLSMWILRVPNTAGQRAILIGIAVGVVATSLRLILGLDRGGVGGRR